MVLSVDSSAVTASAALTDGETVVRSEFQNTGLTHSETLLPMIKRVIGDCKISSIDKIAVTAGPGSFTGVRIGVATVKGLAFKDDIPCVGISTLEAVAYNFIGENRVVCAVMDARRMQFYNALFDVRGNTVKRLCADRAISIDELKLELAEFDDVVISGDGAHLCYNNLGLGNVRLADDDKIYQNAVAVALAAKNKKAVSSSQLMPVYLRPSQAERELKRKGI